LDHVRRDHDDVDRFFHGLAGLSGIIQDDFYAVLPNYVLKFDVTTWGWIHLIGGVVIVLAGFGVFSGAVWARTVGVILAAVSALVSFAWIPLFRSGLRLDRDRRDRHLGADGPRTRHHDGVARTTGRIINARRYEDERG
jgi:hypothetical protein